MLQVYILGQAVAVWKREYKSLDLRYMQDVHRHAQKTPLCGARVRGGDRGWDSPLQDTNCEFMNSKFHKLLI